MGSPGRVPEPRAVPGRRWGWNKALLQGWDVDFGALLWVGARVAHPQPFLNPQHCFVSPLSASEHPWEAGSFHQPGSAIGAPGPEEQEAKKSGPSFKGRCLTTEDDFWRLS